VHEASILCLAFAFLFVCRILIFFILQEKPIWSHGL